MFSFPRSFLKLKLLLVYLTFEFLQNFIMEIMFAGEKSFGLMRSIAWLKLEDEFLG